jgi:hypothetical protein
MCAAFSPSARRIAGSSYERKWRAEYEYKFVAKRHGSIEKNL